VSKKEISKAASAMGKSGYRAKMEKLGIARIQEIARENGKNGGRPKGSGKKRTEKGGK
jgi:hypothetical protein